jgi:hypothetical protein
MKRLLVPALCSLLALEAIGQTPATTLPVTQTLRIDGARNDLVPIEWLAVGPTGTIAISQLDDKAVRLFSANGASIAKIGRAGAGPGEFRTISRVGWLGDTVWIADRSLQRFTLTSASGAALRTMPYAHQPGDLTATPNDIRLSQVSPVALMAGGKQLLSGLRGPGAVLPGPYPKGSLFLWVGVNHRVEHFAVQPPDEGLIGTATATATSPFGVDAYAAASPDGALLAIVPGSYADIAKGFVRVVVMKASGDTVFSREIRLPMTPIPKAVADSAMAERIASLKDAELRREYPRRALVPASYPPVTGLTIGRDGTVWIRGRAGANTRPYFALDRTGQVIGTATLPARSRVHAGERGTLWAVEEDDLGFESIVRYSVGAPRR